MSQINCETHEAEASHIKIENHPNKASRTNVETQYIKANQESKENQPSLVSHLERENHVDAASQNPKENHPVLALDSQIRALIEVYYDVQDVRIRSFNRLRQVGEVQGVEPDILKQLEKQIRDYIKVYLKDKPIAFYLQGIRGIGPILAGGLVSWIDISKAKHASSLWKYCGLHVENGKAVKRVKGQKIGFNPRMRTFAWKIADSFLKQRTPFYRDLYDEAKLEEAEKLKHPELNPQNCPHYKECTSRLEKAAKRKGAEVKKLPCKKHIDYRARRKMVKRFLLDLWLTWRRLEGLPISEPYAVAVLGHQKQAYLPSNPMNESEPSPRRNPYNLSEPSRFRKPCDISEPMSKRKPRTYSAQKGGL